MGHISQRFDRGAHPLAHIGMHVGMVVEHAGDGGDRYIGGAGHIANRRRRHDPATLPFQNSFAAFARPGLRNRLHAVRERNGMIDTTTSTRPASGTITRRGALLGAGAIAAWAASPARAMLDAAEADGAVTLDDVVRALVQPSLDLRSDPEDFETYHRFISNIMGERRELFESTIVDRHAVGYQRATQHVRRLLGDVPPAEIDRRIVFATLSLQAIFTAREAACDAVRGDAHPFWGRADVTQGIFTTTATILRQRDPNG
ncbi:hypothetical protein LTR94_026432 [Friedmanniomyces endolithicus]|nr:hypothetical protein LTR94_026432 [Friedmanniomyces endolithicus]